MREELVVFVCVFLLFSISNLIIIYEGKKRRLDNVGLDIGTRFFVDTLRVYKKNKKQKETDKMKFLFVEETCITCMTLLSKIEKNVELYHNLNIVFICESDTTFQKLLEYKKIFDEMSIYYIEKKEVENKLNITAFPFYYLIENGDIIEKGFPTFDNL